jgi:hypothetical protein
MFFLHFLSHNAKNKMPILAGVAFFETHPTCSSLLGPVLLSSLGITEKNRAGLYTQ